MGRGEREVSTTEVLMCQALDASYSCLAIWQWSWSVAEPGRRPALAHSMDRALCVMAAPFFWLYLVAPGPTASSSVLCLLALSAPPCQCQSCISSTPNLPIYGISPCFCFLLRLWVEGKHSNIEHLSSYGKCHRSPVLPAPTVSDGPGSGAQGFWSRTPIYWCLKDLGPRPWFISPVNIRYCRGISFLLLISSTPLACIAWERILYFKVKKTIFLNWSAKAENVNSSESIFPVKWNCFTNLACQKNKRRVISGKEVEINYL